MNVTYFSHTHTQPLEEMKRERYSIEGDPIGSTCFVNKPRYMGVDFMSLPTSLTETYFAILPVEVTCLILGYAAPGDPRHYQSLLRYILPIYDVSLAIHHKTYNVTQTMLLTMAQIILKEEQPLLFQASVRERLGRISSTINLNEPSLLPTDQVLSIKAISNASFVELFAFTNCLLCECCLCNLAATRRLYRLESEKFDDDLVPLCYYCGNRMDYTQRVRENEKTLDIEMITKKPRMAYRWLDEKKVRRWCSIPRYVAIGDVIPMTLVRRNTYNCFPSSPPVTLYLLKDILPYVQSRYISVPLLK